MTKLNSVLIPILSGVLVGIGLTVGCKISPPPDSPSLSQARRILTNPDGLNGNGALVPAETKYWDSSQGLIQKEVWALRILKVEGNLKDLEVVRGMTNSTDEAVRSAAAETYDYLQRRLAR